MFDFFLGLSLLNNLLNIVGKSLPGGEGVGGGRLLINCVPMREHLKERKAYSKQCVRHFFFHA